MPYALISGFLILVSYTRKRPMGIWAEHYSRDYRGRRLFYVLICECVLLAGLLAAVGLGGSWIPWLMSQCTDTRIQGNSTLRAMVGPLSSRKSTTACHEMAVEQIMAVCLM